jgi:hypothetical protein
VERGLASPALLYNAAKLSAFAVEDKHLVAPLQAQDIAQVSRLGLSEPDS